MQHVWQAWRRETCERSGAIWVLSPIGAPVILTFILARFKRAPRFSWSPALDFTDHEVYSALIPGVQY